MANGILYASSSAGEMHTVCGLLDLPPAVSTSDAWAWDWFPHLNTLHTDQAGAVWGVKQGHVHRIKGPMIQSFDLGDVGIDAIEVIGQSRLLALGDHWSVYER